MNATDNTPEIERHPRGSRERLRAIVEVTRRRLETAQQIRAEVHGGDPRIADLAQSLWEVDHIKLSPGDLDLISAAAVTLLGDATYEMDQRQLERLTDDLDALARAVERRLAGLPGPSIRDADHVHPVFVEGLWYIQCEHQGRSGYALDSDGLPRMFQTWDAAHRAIAEIRRHAPGE
jgi:hypothetical protein